MFYVYVLKSKHDDKLYIGFTSDLRKRFEEHNKGLVQSTKPRIPFSLVYYEAYTDEKDARERERKLKRFGASMVHLRKRLKYSLIVSK